MKFSGMKSLSKAINHARYVPSSSSQQKTAAVKSANSFASPTEFQHNSL